MKPRSACVRKSRIMHEHDRPDFIRLTLCIICLHNAWRTTTGRTHGRNHQRGHQRPEPSAFGGKRWRRMRYAACALSIGIRRYRHPKGNPSLRASLWLPNRETTHERGYGRLSTDGRSVAAQVERFTRAAAEKAFKEKVSGAAVTLRQPLKHARLPHQLITALERGFLRDLSLTAITTSPMVSMSTPSGFS